MKTTSQVECPASWFTVRTLGPAAVVAACFLAAVSSATAAAEAKPYALFMGVDFDLLRNKEYYRVRDVVGGSFVIKAKGEEVKVPMNTESTNFRIEQSLKLAATTGLIEHLKGERAYTPANDPRKKWQAMGSSVDIGNATRNMVVGEVNLNYLTSRATASSSGGPGMAPAPVTAEDLAEATSRLNDATSSFNSGVSQGQSDMVNPGYNAGKMQAELDKGLFDAIDVSFEVSSEIPLKNPYVVIIAQYHEPDSKPGMVRNWIYAEAMEPINQSPQKVRVKRGGLPPGYILEQFQVHLYDGGRELATTVSPKRVPLTRDEAFLYLMMDYLGRHKGADHPAGPALGKLNEEAKDRLTDTQWKQTYYVKVTKDGLPVAAFTDESCSQPVEAVIASLVENVRFYPALEKGKPVKGIVPLKFSKLPL